jgi:hypothetical protein
MLFISNQFFSQTPKGRFGFGGAVGFIDKVQLHSILSKQNQLTAELGSITFIDGDFQIGAIGGTYKYFLSSDDLTNYVGFGVTYMNTIDDYLYYYIPMGLQKYATKDLAFFAGLNPGLYSPIEGEMSFVLAVEVGVTFYFDKKSIN